MFVPDSLALRRRQNTSFLLKLLRNTAWWCSFRPSTLPWFCAPNFLPVAFIVYFIRTPTKPMDSTITARTSANISQSRILPHATLSVYRCDPETPWIIKVRREKHCSLRIYFLRPFFSDFTTFLRSWQGFCDARDTSSQRIRSDGNSKRFRSCLEYDMHPYDITICFSSESANFCDGDAVKCLRNEPHKIAEIKSAMCTIPTFSCSQKHLDVVEKLGFCHCSQWRCSRFSATCWKRFRRNFRPGGTPIRHYEYYSFWPGGRT